MTRGGHVRHDDQSDCRSGLRESCDMSMLQPSRIFTTPSQNPFLGDRPPTYLHLLGSASEREPGTTNIKISWRGIRDKHADLVVGDSRPKTASLISNSMSPTMSPALHHPAHHLELGEAGRDIKYYKKNPVQY